MTYLQHLTTPQYLPSTLAGLVKQTKFSGSDYRDPPGRGMKGQRRKGPKGGIAMLVGNMKPVDLGIRELFRLQSLFFGIFLEHSPTKRRLGYIIIHIHISTHKNILSSFSSWHLDEVFVRCYGACIRLWNS